jgi:hypothetical protein
MAVYRYRTYPPLGSEVESVEFDYEQLDTDNLLLFDPVSGFPVKRINYAGQAPKQLSPSFQDPRDSSGCCGGGCGCHS